MALYDPVRSAMLHDAEGRPTAAPSLDEDKAHIEPFRDEAGNVTRGGLIGFYLGYALLLGICAAIYLSPIHAF